MNHSYRIVSVDDSYQFPKQNPAVKSNVIVIAILFTAFLILSNLTAFKLVMLGSLVFPAGIIFFPLIYVFDDILTEVYGFKVSRRIMLRSSYYL